MRFTRAIEQSTINLDPSFRFFGAEGGVEAVVTARLQGTERIVHQSAWNALSDGQRIYPGDDMSFSLPAVDQSGWVGADGGPAAPWTYELRVSVTAPGRSPIKWFGVVAPTMGTAVRVAPSDGVTTGYAATTSGTVDPATGHIAGGSSGSSATLTRVSPGIYELSV